MVHITSAGRLSVTGANGLVAIFSEPESYALHYLRKQDMARYGAVNFIAHGIVKNGNRGARNASS